MMKAFSFSDRERQAMAEDYEVKLHIAKDMLKCADAGLAAIKYVCAVDAQFKTKKFGQTLNKSAYTQMKQMMENFLSDNAEVQMTSYQMIELLNNYKADVTKLESIAKTYRRNVWLARKLFGIEVGAAKNSEVKYRQRTQSLNFLLLIILVGLGIFNFVN